MRNVRPGLLRAMLMLDGIEQAHCLENYPCRKALIICYLEVFEYFASYRTLEGELLMKTSDLMRAVVLVVPSSESKLVRDGYLRGERSPGQLRCPPDLFMLLDVNNAGIISFKECLGIAKHKNQIPSLRAVQSVQNYEGQQC